MTLEFTRSEAKQWAKEHYKGLDGVLSPSFTPDLKELDEEGIRFDVQHNISKGMFSILCQTEVCAMTFEERKKFLEIACDEANGKILVSMFTGIDTIEQDMEQLSSSSIWCRAGNGKSQAWSDRTVCPSVAFERIARGCFR
ncbi:MAG TPA: hypothetical protein G4O15_10615 [Dehalococcoidia bacterium]|nr:hypothetical protein [Dehalococcoidia bacterium]